MRPASAEETAFADLSADMQFSMSILGECPQRDEAIAESSWAGRMIAGQGRANAHSEIYIYERTGSMKRRVVVTGLGAVTPIGNTVEEFWNNIKKGTVGIGEITKFDTTDYKVKIAAEVKDFVAKERMDFKSAKRMEPFSQYAVAAAKEAYEDAGLDISKEEHAI